MTDEKKTLTFYQAHPDRYKIGSNGSVYDLQAGRFCDLIVELNPYAITPENARQMADRKRQIGQIAQLRGLARGAGLDLDNATLEDIAKGAGDAIENMTKHFYDVFMKSNNVRGLAEAFKGLTAPMLGEREEKTIINLHEIAVSQATVKLLDNLRQVVEGTVIDDEDRASS